MGTVGGVGEVEPEGARDPLLEDRTTALGVERELAAHQMVRVEVAEDHVRVGDRRVFAALAVADRARRRARALRPALHGAARVDPDDGAAARPDLREVDGRHLDEVARPGEEPRPLHDAAADAVLERAGELPAFDERRLRGGPPHVEGDHVRQPHLAREGLGPDHPAGRPGLDDVAGQADGVLDGGEPPVRLHEHQRRGDRRGLQLAAERLQVARHRRHDVGVDHGGRGPLVLLDLRQHLVADARDEPGRPLRDHLLHQQLVDGVLEGVEQAHRDRLDPLGDETVHRRLRVLAGEGADDLPARVDPLVHLHPKVALDQLRRLLPPEVVQARHPQVPKLEHVAEAAGRDEAGERSLVLEDRVGRDGGSVADLGHVRAREGGLVEHLAETAGDRLCIVLDARGDLAGVDPAPGVEEHDVGKRSADVDTDAVAIHGRASPRVRGGGRAPRPARPIHRSQSPPPNQGEMAAAPRVLSRWREGVGRMPDPPESRRRRLSRCITGVEIQPPSPPSAIPQAPTAVPPPRPDSVKSPWRRPAGVVSGRGCGASTSTAFGTASPCPAAGRPGHRTGWS